MHVLIATADPELVERTSRGLAGEAFVVYLDAGRGVLETLARAEPDLVILDLPSLPAGWELLHGLRAQSEVPLIVLVADRSADERIEALERGADDSQGRCVDPAELGARMRAVLRRAQKAATPAPLGVGALRLDPARSEAYVAGAPLGLRPHEFSMLLALARNPGVVFSRQSLLQLLSGTRAWALRPETLDVYAARVRRKLVGSGVAIQAVRGVGYKLVLGA